jgi:nicotinamide-nucleotide amidase
MGVEFGVVMKRRRDTEPMEVAVGRLLLRRGETLSLAESCTGGGIGERVTRVPGCSAWFIEGRVVYSNEAKRRSLGVSSALLARHGAVSRECALAMASGVRRRTKTDWGLSVTGIAGPGGGSKEKPVGLVFIALVGPGVRDVDVCRFAGDRGNVRSNTIRRALGLLRAALERTR